MRTRRSRGGRLHLRSKRSKRSRPSVASPRNADYPDLTKFLETHKKDNLCALYDKLQISYDGRVAYFLQQKDKSILDISFRLKNGIMEGWKLRTHANALKVAKLIDTYYIWDPSQLTKIPTDNHRLDVIQKQLARRFPLCKSPAIIEQINSIHEIS